jgi:hypothetical protein
MRRLSCLILFASVGTVIGWSGVAFGYGTVVTPSTASCTISESIVPAGTSVTITCTGFAPLESVTFLLNDPTNIGSATTDASGDVSSSVLIPSNSTPGPATITVAGASGDSATVSFTITTAGAVAPATISSSTSGLAFTGADIGIAAGIGAVALGLGGALVLVGRRRRIAE